MESRRRVPAFRTIGYGLFQLPRRVGASTHGVADVGLKTAMYATGDRFGRIDANRV